MHLSIYSTCLSLSVLYSFSEINDKQFNFKINNLMFFLLVSRVNILYILVNYKASIGPLKI